MRACVCHAHSPSSSLFLSMCVCESAINLNYVAYFCAPPADLTACPRVCVCVCVCYKSIALKSHTHTHANSVVKTVQKKEKKSE